MTSDRFLWLAFYMWAIMSVAISLRCDRRPYGTMTQPSDPDGRFQLVVQGTEDTYIPGQVYTVQITATDGESNFIGFMISVEGDTKTDPNNPRRIMSLLPGDLRPQSQTTAKFSNRCLYSVEQTTISLKSSVEVYWQAPASSNGCVTLRAMVAENEETWFEDGSPLTKRLCEDLSQPDDVTPQLNYDCQICDEAKYELQFTGIWSRNTHLRLYPENDWVPRYSDLVGASHAPDFILWSPGTLATDGLRDLAEHANTTQLETEIREKIGDGIRTLVKGKGHGHGKMNVPTYAIFRADRAHHVISTAIGLHPSPDWFLGVARFELCQEDNTWLQERNLNLYPWDAGTDSGVSYESPKVATYPQDAVSRVEMSSYDKNSPFFEVSMQDLHPFGTLRIKLMKTYHRECEETDENVNTSTEQATVEPGTTEAEPEPPSRYQNQVDSGDYGREDPVDPDSEPSEDCPMSKWQKWSPCEGVCDNGKIVGFKWRERYHLVDGVAVEKYDPDIKVLPRKEVSKYCKSHYVDFEEVNCEEDCSDIRAQRRRVNVPIIPGQPWSSKKRDLPIRT